MSLFDLLGAAALYAPFLAIAVLLAGSRMRRAAWARSHRLTRPPAALLTSAASLAIAFQQLQIFYRPSMTHVFKVERKEEAEDDDSGEPDSPAAHLHRQLRRIRGGEPLDALVLRL